VLSQAFALGLVDPAMEPTLHVGAASTLLTVAFSPVALLSSYVLRIAAVSEATLAAGPLPPAAGVGLSGPTPLSPGRDGCVMAEGSRAAQKDRYVAVIDQDKVTDEVRDIALKYDPLNRTPGRQGFHVTEDGELHIDDANVIEEHRIVANKVPNDAIKILRLPAERGELVHRYGENGFRLYELPVPQPGRAVGLLGPNGTGKSTALRVLDGSIRPNLGQVDDPPSWSEVISRFRGTAAQNYLAKLAEDDVETADKPQRVDRLPDHHEDTAGALVRAADERGLAREALARFELASLADRDIEELSGGELQRLAIAATLVRDVDAYLVDEPSAYLDVGQRLTVARGFAELAADRGVLVVDHDLVTLDVLADDVHLTYGEPGGFGVVSRPLTTRRGINAFIEGMLRREGIRIREEPLTFEASATQTQGEPAISAPRLAKRFDGFELVVDPVDLREGELVGVLGRNGLGKTTFARLLAGVLEPDEGEIETRRTVAYKPQYLQADFAGTVEALLASQVDLEAPWFRAQILGPFDLEDLLEAPVAALSGGERQRVAVGLTLAREADAYLLDEPSAYLDVERRVDLATQLRRVIADRAAPCLVVDHDLMLLDALADRVMVFEGTPGEQGHGCAPEPTADGLDAFLAEVDVTFRRDERTGRPRANDPGSRKDREQREAGDYYAA
jgi:ATP-binding cassette subfamily E protein 1